MQYQMPDEWIVYDPTAVFNELAEAKAAILSLDSLPCQRSWFDHLQVIELKREVAGTSRIEGADFTEHEFEQALLDDTDEFALTRSQRQARAAINTYRWILRIPRGRPIDVDLIKEIHARIVTGCDDDHCPPGQLRQDGQNVTFGRPRHRGIDGGKSCARALRQLVEAASSEFRGYDSLIQALAMHYHIGAIHPFLDGNGRTARALEALMLDRARMPGTLFVSMSGFYYDEKSQYLSSLSEAGQQSRDITPFLKFGLRGIAGQCQRMLSEVTMHVQKSLFRDVMGQMYGRLRSKRKCALAHRQCEILRCLLDQDREIQVSDVYKSVRQEYASLKIPSSAFIRDLNHLEGLRAIIVRSEQFDGAPAREFFVKVRLEWATEITETEFFRQINQLPQAKTRFVGTI